jgi:hypothetical protein
MRRQRRRRRFRGCLIGAVSEGTHSSPWTGPPLKQPTTHACGHSLADPCQGHFVLPPRVQPEACHRASRWLAIALILLNWPAAQKMDLAEAQDRLTELEHALANMQPGNPERYVTFSTVVSAACSLNASLPFCGCSDHQHKQLHAHHACLRIAAVSARGQANPPKPRASMAPLVHHASTLCTSLIARCQPVCSQRTLPTAHAAQLSTVA